MAQSPTWTKLQAGTEQDRFYAAILSTIRQKGTQNKQYKSDYDITYGELTKLIGGRVPGLVALLNTMKKKKAVDFDNEGGILKDPSMGPKIAADMEEWLNSLGGWRSLGVMPSPIAGGDGNLEYLLAGRKE